MKRILISSISALLLTTAANAQVNPNTGCGLGSVIIKDQSTVVMQVLAATTNGTSGNQTFGITTGTLNCDKPSNFVSNDKLQKFVGENMDELAMDISAGQGETLNTVATLMNVQDKASFNAKLKENFSSIYANENVTSANVIDSIAKYM
ncbi:hypothetical protein GCM10012288_11450 [Malaciobacter pacificus]|jgi:opacity protein-like surface antigen|uniref:DUF3015 domain-containing protein n=1 Tax=Malaciobacter pacificus TaxID=1080223 RepID=A0A5C2H7X0_9BACT|nr:DUF3015 family protein [Malaciobacter pacificus]QEP33575.1 DUF3015 domain-containing protein [Malaciobacter pacificus]GGD39115.1 hypothetical protein GCM10012288_11450 [Malaciobacter pacificus]